MCGLRLFYHSSCAVHPSNKSSTCGTNSKIAPNESTAPRGEPGRLTMRTRPQLPEMARDRAANMVDSAPFPPHELAETGDFTLENVTRRFRRDITGRDAGSAGCENDADLVPDGQISQ